METCVLEGCDRPLNRDGLCFYHKIRTLHFATEEFARERKGKGWGVDAGAGTRENVRAMYEQRRREGLPDPIPANSKAAAFAPAMGPVRDKKLKEVNA